MALGTELRSDRLEGHRVALVGQFAGMSRRGARQYIRAAGGTTLDAADASATLVVLGEDKWPLPDEGIEALLGDPIRAALDRGDLEVITETQLWQRLGLVDGEQEIHALYTPAMLADMLNVPVSVVRRWQRRGLIAPVRSVGRLPYFDFQQVAAARRLAELIAQGMSPAAIERQLAALVRYVPQARQSLAQLSVIVEGRRLLLRQGGGLIDTGGQRRLDFDSAEPSREPQVDAAPVDQPDVLALGKTPEPSADDPSQMLALAAELEDEGRLGSAVELYRAALVAAGADAEISFRIAELLYRTDDLTAARERYYVAIELDPTYVEARANLGCVLAEMGQLDLAVAAFEGALNYHADYADAHYHLARTYDELGRPDRAEQHWRSFMQLAPNSPWAAEGRQRLGIQLAAAPDE